MRAKLRFEDDRATLGIAVARHRELELHDKGRFPGPPVLLGAMADRRGQGYVTRPSRRGSPLWLPVPNPAGTLPLYTDRRAFLEASGEIDTAYCYTQCKA